MSWATPGIGGAGGVLPSCTPKQLHWAVPTAATRPRDQAPLSLPAGRRRLPQHRQEGADGEHEVLQQEAGKDVPGAQWPGSGDPLHLEGTLSSVLPTDGGEHPAPCGWLGRFWCWGTVGGGKLKLSLSMKSVAPLQKHT